MLDIHPDELAPQVRGRLSDGFDGYNVTVPHKVRILPLLDETSDSAREVGAVNTVVRKDGRLTGHNTDAMGFEESLRPFGPSLSDTEAAVIGSGGAARAAVHVLLRKFAPSRVHILSRNHEQAVHLRESVPSEFRHRVDVVSGNPETVETALRSTLIVQATPVGMYPNAGDRPLPGSTVFREGQVVFDLVYRPRETAFLRDARRAGAEVIGGLEMFLYQAAAAFRLWTGATAPLEAIRPIIEEEIDKP